MYGSKLHTNLIIASIRQLHLCLCLWEWDHPAVEAFVMIPRRRNCYRQNGPFSSAASITVSTTSVWNPQSFFWVPIMSSKNQLTMAGSISPKQNEFIVIVISRWKVTGAPVIPNNIRRHSFPHLMKYSESSAVDTVQSLCNRRKFL